MRKFIIALSLVQCLQPSSLVAQTVELALNVNALGFANHNLVAVDADGNPTTREWLAVPTTTGGLYQMVSLSPTGSICFGTPFAPGAGLQYSTITVNTANPRTVLEVRESLVFALGATFRTVGLTRPPC